jgi:hypothetical protein
VEGVVVHVDTQSETYNMQAGSEFGANPNRRLAEREQGCGAIARTMYTAPTFEEQVLVMTRRTGNQGMTGAARPADCAVSRHPAVSRGAAVTHRT